MTKEELIQRLEKVELGWRRVATKERVNYENDINLVSALGLSIGLEAAAQTLYDLVQEAKE